MKPKIISSFFKAPKIRQDIETRFITKIFKEDYKKTEPLKTGAKDAVITICPFGIDDECSAI